MKKVGILTLYDSFNFGTFLQAYALMQFLREKKYDVYIIKNNVKNKYIKWIKNKNIKKVIFNISQANKFYKAQKIFKIESAEKEFDSVVIGSDEIWSIKNRTFPHHKKYFGYDLNSENIIAYAPSCNNVTAQDLKEFYNNDIDLNNFNALSVRDDSTATLLKDLGYNEFEYVLDPTFLIVDKYTSILKKNNNHNYILVYGYQFNDEQIKCIKEYAKNQNQKLIAIGLYHPWCDINIKADPFEFLGYVKQADKVITSTFHGTVFSIIFNKPFATFTNGKKKIEGLLDIFNLSNRIVKNFDLDEKFKEKINYQEKNEEIQKRAEKSKEYLNKNLKKEAE